MPAETDLYAALVNAPDVLAVVGSRIFSDTPDEDEPAPYIFYERIDTETINTIHTGLPIAEISQFALVCYAETREQAEALGDLAAIAAAGTPGGLIYVGRQGEYDPDTRLFAAAIVLQHNK